MHVALIRYTVEVPRRVGNNKENDLDLFRLFG